MMVEIKGRKIIHRGFSPSRHYFYWSELNIPEDWFLVEKGKVRENDMVMVQAPPFPSARSYKRYLGKEAKIRAKWEVIKSENVNKDVGIFRAVIRKNKGK